MTTKTRNSMVEVIRPESVLDSIRRVHDIVGGLVASTNPQHLNDPTPCKDWNVRTLINHLVDINIRYAAMANGDEMPAPGTDHLGDDFREDYRRAAHASLAAFERPGMIEQSYPTPWGDAPGSVIVQHCVNELIAHGWDLARATGRPTNLVPDLAEESLRIWRAWFDDIGRQDAMFDPPREAPKNATPADEIAAFLGRRL